MKYLYLVLNWVFGVLFLLSGGIFLVNAPLSALLFISIAALLLPPIRQRVGDRTGMKISPVPRGVAILILFSVSGMLVEAGWPINVADLAVMGVTAFVVGGLLLYDAIRSRGVGVKQPRGYSQSEPTGNVPTKAVVGAGENSKGRFTELGEAVVVDTETTGLDHKEDRVIEVAALVVNFETFHGRVEDEIESFSRRIKADRPISKGALSVHGINDTELEHEPSFGEVAAELREFIGDRPLVGHNVAFDKKFLHSEFKRVGVPSIWKNKVYCTQKRLGYYFMFNGIGHKRPRLDDALRIFSLDGRRGDLHGAYEDVELTFRLALALRELDALPGDVKERWNGYFT